MENENLTTDESSLQGDTSKQVEPEVQPQAQVQPLTEERVQQLIAQATERAMIQGKELGRREMQATKDREVGQALGRAKKAEQQLSHFDTSLTDLDEESRDKIELARLRAKDKAYSQADAEDKERQEREATARQLEVGLISELKEWGVDPGDSRIDWATDVQGNTISDYFKGKQRFDASVRKIVIAQRGEILKTQAKDKETLRREVAKEAGLESHDTSFSASAGSDESFMVAFGKGEIDATEANLKRATAIHKRILGG